MECRSSSGFTLLELAVTCAVFAVILTVAVPSFLDFTRNSRLTAQAHGFITAMNVARSEAIKRNTRVIICVQAANQCGNSLNWERGWIVFADDNLDSTPQLSEIIRRFSRLAEDYTLRPNVSVSALYYHGEGDVSRPSGALPMMTFRLCAPDASLEAQSARSREIVINATGRLRLQPGRGGQTDCPSL